MISKNRKKYIKKIYEYLAVMLITNIILIVVLKLWKADLSIPFIYGGDSLFSGALIKGVIQNGWYLDNNFIGMPTGLNFRDYPISDNLHFIIIKIISIFCSDYGIVMNLFFLLTFPLTSITSFIVFRHLEYPFIIALMGSLLYSFIPNHFFRNVGHIFLAAYYIIPLLILIMLWIWKEKNPLFIKKNGSLKISFLNPYLIIAIIICILVSSSGIYFSYFGCFFLFITGLISSSKMRSYKPLILALFLIFLITIGSIINISPTIYYWYKNGKNSEIAVRSFYEPEFYGLKIAQLILPIRDHRIRIFSEIKEIYNRNAPMVNENDWVSLGVIGSTGFLFLIVAIFFERIRSWDSYIAFFSYLNISGLLLSTIGGFSTLISFIFPYIRGYNRISFYIAFFSIFIFCLLLKKLYEKIFFNKRAIFYIIVLVILILGILDQTSPSFIPPYDEKKKYHYEQKRFIKEVERALPEKAMIFQLPYFPFPESLPLNKMHDYDHFGGGYLFSDKLRWSYGAMKGREGDLWQRCISKKSLEEFLEIITLAGFKAVYIDRYGFQDSARSIEEKIQKIINKNPFESPNKRYSIFPLIEYENLLKSKYKKGEWELKAEMAKNPILLFWGGGFYGIESKDDKNWRWCKDRGFIRLINSSSKEKKVEIEMILATGFMEDYEIKISGLIKEKIKVNCQGVNLKRSFLVPPGKHIIHFQTNAPPIEAPGDLRKLVFRIDNFKIKELIE